MGGVVNVVEEGRHGVEVLCRVRVVLVIVTLSATHGGSHPHLRQVAYSVCGIHGDVFLLLDASLVRGLQQTVVARGDSLVDCRAW